MNARHFTLFLLLLVPSLMYSGVNANPITETDRIIWESSMCLPEKDGNEHLGLAGVFSAYVDGSLIVAGGANFPAGLPSRGGIKKWWGDVYVHDGDSWRVFENLLPSPVAYGCSVSLDDGLLCIGGCCSDECLSEVYKIGLSESGEPVIEMLSPMPVPLANAAGCRIGNKVYIAGGISSMEHPVAQKVFLCYDINTGVWEQLEPWHGKPRAFAVCAPQSDGVDNCVYLFSGRDFDGDGPWDVLNDAWKYNPRLGIWTELDGIFPVMAGTAAPLGTNHILFFGGRAEDGTDDNVLRLYHTVTSTLTEVPVDAVVIPVTTCLAVNGKEMTIVSGETAPGVRTPVILKATLESTMKKMGVLDIIVIILYFAVLSLIGVYFSKRQKSAEDYMKGGGRIPWLIVGLSIFATGLSAITFMSIPAKAYATDWSYMFFNAGIIIVVPVIVLLFIPFFRRLNVTTAYEYLERRFNPFVRVLCSVAFIVFQIGRMGVVLLLPSIALNVVTGFDIFLCIILMGGLSLIYTYIGGMEAVAWTDAIQAVVLLGAAVTVLCVIGFSLPDGFGQIFSVAHADGKFNMGDMKFDLRQPTFWTVMIATIFTNITTYGTDQTIVQRYLTTETEKKARKGVYTNAILSIPATLIFFAVGTAIYVWFKQNPMELSASITDADAILPWYVSLHMPQGVLGLIIAGIFAAAMSTLSSSINSVATAWVTDIQPRLSKGFDVLAAARKATLVSGIVGILFALLMATWDIKSLWDEFSKILGILLGGLGGLFLLGFLSRRANSAGAIVGLISSMLVQIIVIRTQAVNLLLYSTVGFIACFVVGYIVSMITGGPRKNVDNITIGSLKKH